jgi:hypothetical protein
MYSDNSAARGTEADRLAKALASYLAIASELSARAEYAAVTGGAEWRRVAGPVLALHEQQLATTFGYVVAKRAKVDGASAWIDANRDAMRRLEAALPPSSDP